MAEQSGKGLKVAALACLGGCIAGLVVAAVVGGAAAVWMLKSRESIGPVSAPREAVPGEPREPAAAPAEVEAAPGAPGTPGAEAPSGATGPGAQEKLEKIRKAVIDAELALHRRDFGEARKSAESARALLDAAGKQATDQERDELAKLRARVDFVISCSSEEASSVIEPVRLTGEPTTQVIRPRWDA